MSAFNYPEMQELEKIADRYNHISNDLETVIDDGANNQYHEDENETIFIPLEDRIGIIKKVVIIQLVKK